MHRVEQAEDVHLGRRLAPPSSPRMFGTCTLAVLGEINSLLAMSRLPQ
jgi:hypothetical protein